MQLLQGTVEKLNVGVYHAIASRNRRKSEGWPLFPYNSKRIKVFGNRLKISIGLTGGDSFKKSIDSYSQQKRHARAEKATDLKEAKLVNGTKVETFGNSSSVEDLYGSLVLDGKHGENILDNGSEINTIIGSFSAAAIIATQGAYRNYAPGKQEAAIEAIKRGELAEMVYRQVFLIHSFEVGPDKTPSMETFLKHFQESALNHGRTARLFEDGFGVTPRMLQHNLIWVITRIRVQVENFPVWGDAVIVETWMTSSGKNGIRRDWIMRDNTSGHVLIRATSTWVMMNKSSRRLSKLPIAVRMELQPEFRDGFAFMQGEDIPKIDKLNDNAEYICSGLTPRYNDLDMNHHVNNVKYLGWILESVPPNVLKFHELVDLALEFRKECMPSNIVESMTSLKDPCTRESYMQYGEKEASDCSFELPAACNLMRKCVEECRYVEFTHLLRLQALGVELVRGRTTWRKRDKRNSH